VIYMTLEDGCSGCFGAVLFVGFIVGVCALLAKCDGYLKKQDRKSEEENPPVLRIYKNRIEE